MEIQVLQNAVAFNAAGLNGTAIQTLNFTVALIWFTPGASYDGTATFEISPDGGTTWFAIDGRLASTIETPINAVVSPANTALYLLPVPAGCLLRVRMSGGTVGTLTVKAALTFYPGL